MNENQQKKYARVRDFFDLREINFDKASKFVAATIGIVYIFGIIGLNYYLWSFGVSEFSLLKTRFLFSGTLLILPILITFASIQIASYQLEFPYSTAIKVANFCFWMVLPIIFVIVLGLGNDQLGILERACNGVTLWFVSILVGTFGFGVLASSMLNLPIPKTSIPASIARLLWTVVYGIAFCLTFAWYLSKFSSEIYPFVPQQFGGAQPVEISFLLGKDAIDLTQSIGLQTEPGKKLTVKVSLLFELSDSYLIKIQNGQIIELDKDIVKGVVRTPL